jgi:hypothetical protein
MILILTDDTTLSSARAMILILTDDTTLSSASAMILILTDDTTLSSARAMILILTDDTTLMKNGVFWDVTPRDSCEKRRFGGTLRLLRQGDKNWYFFAACVGSKLQLVVSLVRRFLSP